MIEFKDGTYVNIDEADPKIEFDLERTIAITNNNSGMFIHKSSQLFGYFIEEHTPKHGVVAVFREKARYHV